MSLKSKVKTIGAGIGLAAILVGAESTGCMRVNCLAEEVRNDPGWVLRGGINSAGEPTIMFGKQGRSLSYDFLNGCLDETYGF